MPASQAVVAKIAFNPSTLKFEASLGLQDEFQNSQGYTQKPCVEKPKQLIITINNNNYNKSMKQRLVRQLNRETSLMHKLDGATS